MSDTQSKADVFILAGPYSNEADIIRSIKKPAIGKIVISMSNPDEKDLKGKSDVHKISTAEELQKQLPDSKVVKAFSTISMANFKQPAINGEQVDSFISGDDETPIK